MRRLPLTTALRILPAEIRSRTTAHVVRATRNDRFELDGADYEYLYHHYNATWRNERAVEVPVARAMLERVRPGPMLEVGNVLHNYLPPALLPAGRVVVDKYEVYDGVINADVMEFTPPRPCAAVVAISTIEHVGWDEEPREPEKAVAAIQRLHSWLAPGGELLVTVPIGHNPALDQYLLDDKPVFERLSFMRRVDARNRWVQAGAQEVRGAAYGSPFPFANAIAVGRSRG